MATANSEATTRNGRIFVDSDGAPLLFYMQPCEECRKVRPLIEEQLDCEKPSEISLGKPKDVQNFEQELGKSLVRSDFGKAHGKNRILATSTPKSKYVSNDDNSTLSEAILEEEETVNSNEFQFFLVGFTPKERIKYDKLLPSSFHDDRDYNSISHVVFKGEAPRDTILLAMAQEVWVLKPSYLDECLRQGKYVEESAHEWGTSTNDPMITKACRKWRLMRQRANGGGIDLFSHWRAAFCPEGARFLSLKRILSAGGAQIFPLSDSPTHIFVDLERNPVDDATLAHLARQNSLCLQVSYIPAFIVDKNVKAEEYLVPEIEL